MTDPLPPEWNRLRSLPANDRISENVGQSAQWHTGGTDIGQWWSQGADESCVYTKEWQRMQKSKEKERERKKGC